MWLKRLILYLRYYLKAFGRTFFYWPMFLFILSLVLFFSIIIPNLFNRLPIFKTWDKIYTVKGYIKEGIKIKKNVFIEVGGRKTLTLDTNGTFSLKFPSQTSINIPLVISTKDTQILKRISFKENSFVLDTSFATN